MRKSRKNRQKEFFTSDDLIKLGIFRSKSELYVAIKNGEAPPAFKDEHNRWMFPVDWYENWLRGLEWKAPLSRRRT